MVVVIVIVVVVVRVKELWVLMGHVGYGGAHFEMGTTSYSIFLFKKP